MPLSLVLVLVPAAVRGNRSLSECDRGVEEVIVVGVRSAVIVDDGTAALVYRCILALRRAIRSFEPFD